MTRLTARPGATSHCRTDPTMQRFTTTFCRRVGLLPLFVFAGCTSEPASQTAALVRDSADIRIIESIEPAWAPDEQWSVEPEPLVRIGSVEGDAPYLFSNIAGALLLADDRIAVADHGSSQVRYFTHDGRFDGHVGGPGEGPGEFSYIRGIHRCGADSLFVFEIDHQNKVFSPARSFVRQARPYDAATVDRRPYTMTCSANGYYVGVGWEPRVASGVPSRQTPPVGFYRAEAPAWVLAPAHAADSGIARIEDAGLVITAELGVFLSSERIGTERGSGPHPFGRSLRLAMDRNGIYLGTGEDFQIHRYSLSGRLERLIRWPGEDVAIREEDIQSYRSAQLATVSGSQRPALERRLREMPMPPAFPAFSRLMTDPGGNLWVERFRRPGQQDQDWMVFDPQGALLGHVLMPPALTLTDIGDDVVLGVSTDELGVERVSMHRLAKGAGELDTPEASR